MRKAIGLVGFCSVVWWNMSRDGAIAIFYDLFSLQICVGIVLSLAITKYTLGELIGVSDEVMKSLTDLSLFGGFFGVMIGLVRMLGFLHDPGEVGMGLMVCTISVFYSLLMASFFFVLKPGVRHSSFGGASLLMALASLSSMLVVLYTFTQTKS